MIYKFNIKGWLLEAIEERRSERERESVSWKERRKCVGPRPRRWRRVVLLSLVVEDMSQGAALQLTRRNSCCRGRTASPSWCSRGWSRWGRWGRPGPPPVAGSCPPAGLHSTYSESCKEDFLSNIYCLCFVFARNDNGDWRGSPAVAPQRRHKPWNRIFICLTLHAGKARVWCNLISRARRGKQQVLM